MNTEKSRSTEPEIESEKRRISLRQLFEKAINKIIDNAPDWLLNPDKQLDEYERSLEETYGVEAGKATAALFDRLAKTGLRRPDKEYTHIPTKSPLVEGERDTIKLLRRLFSKAKSSKSFKHRVIDANTTHMFKLRGTYREDFRDDEESGTIRQVLLDSVKQEGSQNIIHEDVENYLTEKNNLGISNLYFYDDKSKRVLDLSQLLPANWHFVPQVLSEWESKVVDESSNPHMIWSKIKTDLNDYPGLAASTGIGMSAVSLTSEAGELTEVVYSGLSREGDMLGLLHETAHAWVGNYVGHGGRKGWESFFSEVETYLSILDKFTRQCEPDELKQRAVDKLRDLGVHVDLKDYQYTNQPLSDFNHKLSLTGGYYESQQALGAAKDFYVESPTVNVWFNSFVSEERDAWAHAIRALRFLRRQGIDLEPQLQTRGDILDEVHKHLKSYQREHEKELAAKPDKYLKKFTTRQ